MRKYDALVVGAGAGGLTMALILAKAGRGVLVLEKSRKPGGALGSFRFSGHRLDAGFHFTGALQDGGLFDQLLKSLGVGDRITPNFLDPDAANIFRFKRSDIEIAFPYGPERLRESLINQFPRDAGAVKRYFDDVERVRDNTPALDLTTLFEPPSPIPEDSITLAAYLRHITRNKILRETLSALIMCHGSAPSEISMADNSRLCVGFYESVATLEGGGSSLSDALLRELEGYGVEIRCETEIAELAKVADKKVGEFVLSDGDIVEANSCVFTINSKSIAELLPRDAFPPAFFQRVDSFECAPGFFTVFAKLDDGTAPVNAASITSEYPVDDINALALPGWNGPGALAVTHSRSAGADIITAFEPIYWASVSKWSASTTGARPPDYHRWKKRKEHEIVERISRIFPSYEGRLSVLASATPLTYRDWLNHYNGAAYGVKNKLGQYNLAGQLRLRNLFVAGQSAFLPGVLGTMMASVIVARTVLGEETVRNVLDL
ncbi:MAG: NAD(P)/FAD-dependent oxidoreductase [Kiritimatiellaeota bacterium]|nr:NAD(P)/FAD-dependent oxidoreductase [Kiritimatiellota bacterium]